MPNIQVNPLVPHPPFPICVFAILGRPVAQIRGASPFNDLGDPMPSIARFLGHVNGISGPESQQQIFLRAVLRLGLFVLDSRRFGSVRIVGMLFGFGVMMAAVWRNHEEAVASEAQADEPLVGFLADVSVHHHSVAGGVEVHNGGFGARLGEECLEEAR